MFVGGGKIVEMVSSLPNVVTTNATISLRAILRGNISITSEAAVSITAGSETTINSGTNIIIEDGASLTLRGIVNVEDEVCISVAQGGTLNFDNSICTFGQGSKIEVNGGSLTINGGSMDKTDDSTTWAGISRS